MKKILIITMIIAMALMPFTAAAITPYSYIDWNHKNGATFTTEMLDCGGYNAENPETGWLHWVLGGTENVTDAQISLDGGITWTPYDSMQGGNIDFYTEPYYTENQLKEMTVTVRYTGTLGTGANAIIKLSHYCPGGETEVPEFPTLAIPIAAIIGLAFIMQRRKE